jgi:uncharacterized protein (TIGR00251 family)
VVRISVRVKPNSKKPGVIKLSDKEFIVKVRAPATEGRANEAVIEALGEYLSIPKTRISIFRGISGKNKIVDIL